MHLAANQFTSWVPPSSLQKASPLIGRVRETSHTCLLVSGEFRSGIVFLGGACFSRLKVDDVCRLLRAALLLVQICTCREPSGNAASSIRALGRRGAFHPFLPLTAGVGGGSVEGSRIARRYQLHLSTRGPWEWGYRSFSLSLPLKI